MNLCFKSLFHYKTHQGCYFLGKHKWACTATWWLEWREKSLNTIRFNDPLLWVHHFQEHPSSGDWPHCTSKPRGFRDSFIPCHATNVFIRLIVLNTLAWLDNTASADFLSSPPLSWGRLYWVVQVHSTDKGAVRPGTQTETNSSEQSRSEYNRPGYASFSTKADALKQWPEYWATVEEFSLERVSTYVSSQSPERDWTLWEISLSRRQIST